MKSRCQDARSDAGSVCAGWRLRGLDRCARFKREDHGAADALDPPVQRRDNPRRAKRSAFRRAEIDRPGGRVNQLDGAHGGLDQILKIEINDGAEKSAKCGKTGTSKRRRLGRTPVIGSRIQRARRRKLTCALLSFYRQIFHQASAEAGSPSGAPRPSTSGSG